MQKVQEYKTPQKGHLSQQNEDSACLSSSSADNFCNNIVITTNHKVKNNKHGKKHKGVAANRNPSSDGSAFADSGEGRYSNKKSQNSN
jgi:hypothetical protein